MGSVSWLPYVEVDGVLLYAVATALVLPVLYCSGNGLLLLPKVLILSLWSGVPLSYLGALKLLFVAGLAYAPATMTGLVLCLVMLSWAMKVLLHGLLLEPQSGESELSSFWFLWG